MKKAEEIPQNKRRETLIQNKDKALLSRKLVTLKEDVPVKDDPSSFIFKNINRENLFNFLREMEFNRLLSQAISFYGEDKNSKINSNSSKTKHSKLDTKLYKSILSEKDLDELIKNLNEKSSISVDTETTSLNPLEANLVGISLSYDTNKAFYIPLAHKNVKSLKKELVLKKIKPTLEDPSIRKIGQNMKYDYIVLKKNGIEVDPVEDTMMLSYTLEQCTLVLNWNTWHFLHQKQFLMILLMT